MAYSSLPLLFGFVAPLTFWACETCQIISYAEAATPAGPERRSGPAVADTPDQLQEITHQRYHR